jgi:hypothetical protein
MFARALRLWEIAFKDDCKIHDSIMQGVDAVPASRRYPCLNPLPMIGEGMMAI